MRTIGKSEMLDIVEGATFLGAGGGGSPVQGRRLVESVTEIAPEIEVVSPDEMPDDAHVAVVAGMGSPVAARDVPFIHAPVRAFEALENVVGHSIPYVLPLEVGGGNSISPMFVAARKGIPLVDGDGAGRAIPELEMTTYVIYGESLSPLAMANEASVSAVLYVDDPRECEDVARAITTQLGMLAGFATHPMTGTRMKEVLIPHTLTQAEEVGRALREAKAGGDDPVDAVLAHMQGRLLGKGRITEVVSETSGGFDKGLVVVEDGLRVDFKNESMLARRGGSPVAMVPDLICCLDTGGQALTNADMQEGLEVAFVGLPADPKWRTPQATQVFSHVLEALGYGGGYVPIEELVG
jgi:DUF917 family protein